MEENTLNVGMIWDVFELGGGDSCAFNVYDRSGRTCLWRKTPHTRPDFPELNEMQRNLKVLRITTTASAIYLDVDAEHYTGPYIHSTGDYF